MVKLKTEKFLASCRSVQRSRGLTSAGGALLLGMMLDLRLDMPDRGPAALDLHPRFVAVEWNLGLGGGLAGSGGAAAWS
jgi:hypothetical protein